MNKTLSQKENIKRSKYEENPKTKKEFEKKKANFEPKKEYKKNIYEENPE